MNIFNEKKITLNVKKPVVFKDKFLKPFEQNGNIRNEIFYRQDFLTKKWANINFARSMRPLTIKNKEDSGRESCVFCPDKKDLLPEDFSGKNISFSINENGKLVTVFPNLYPWLILHSNIVETVEHKFYIKDLEVEEEYLAFKAARIFFKKNNRAGFYKMFFRNNGVGASISHYHWQVGFLPRKPARLAKEIKSAKEFFDSEQKNFFDVLLDKERESGERFIWEDDLFAIISPFAPRTNYEVWIISKYPVLSLLDIPDDNWLYKLSKLFVRVMKSLGESTKINDFNVMVFQANDEKEYRFHIKIYPYKGFSASERGFEEFAVEVIPEFTAKMLKKSLKNFL